jgi:hypothetical protein
MENHLKLGGKINGESIAVDEDEVQRHPLQDRSRLGLLEWLVKMTKDPFAYRTRSSNEQAHRPAMMTPKDTSVEAKVPRSPVDTGSFVTSAWVPLVEWWSVWI